MTRYSSLALIVGLTFSATTLSAGPGKPPLRSDTDFPSNFTGSAHDPVTKDPQASNWPGLPERQAGRSYSKLIHTTSGVRERNAESGRR